MKPDDPVATAACAFGDPGCPCQDGDVCHYVDDPKSETLAMTPPTLRADVDDPVGTITCTCGDVFTGANFAGRMSQWREHTEANGA